MNWLTLAPSVLGGIAACALAVAIATFLVTAPRQRRLPLERRRPPAASGPTTLAGAAKTATTLIDKILRSRGGTVPWQSALERAGVRMPVQEFGVLLVVGVLVGGAGGVVLSGFWLGLGFALAVPLLAKVVLNVKAGRRRSAFADQLDDSLQLIASSLRAGHSLLQSLAAVAREAEEPTREEFSRILNETRVGREVGHALDETAARMGSEDFFWVTEAIAINREVGGNLAEVLDGVGHTIRERNQIRGQVKALSAEGKLSAYVLMALPFGISGFLSVSNPVYMAKFTQSFVGYGLIGLCVVMLTVGALWLRKVVSFKF